MDLIRIFIDTAFSKVAEPFLKENGNLTSETKELILKEGLFVDVCRMYHPELSDDQIRMIYRLYKDEWAYSEEDLENGAPDENPSARIDIFNVLFRFSGEMIRLRKREPVVKFNHLFRWREITLNIGEDVLVAAYYAAYNEHKPFVPASGHTSFEDYNPDGIDFCSWPTILHNDNPHLTYIFTKLRLTELHSHLYASTDNFGISWVCLMNEIAGKDGDFGKVCKNHESTGYKTKAKELYAFVVMAASIRLKLWRMINGRECNVPTDYDSIAKDVNEVAKKLGVEISKEKTPEVRLDYINVDLLSPMNVLAGERKFLYCIFRLIRNRKDEDVSFLLYKYLLAKNRLRSFMVQVNSNRGFANFQNYQKNKAIFLNKKYTPLLSRLAVWEAARFNYTDVFETRISPSFKFTFRDTKRSIIDEGESIRRADYGDEEPQWSFLFHFIKHAENIEEGDMIIRDGELRKVVRRQSVALKNLLSPEKWNKAGQSYLGRLRGIDAASSEIGCRPEIFAQAFRYLKDAGYAATFHAGEDFYDIADGLRAIQEAIDFLGLEPGDRIGHALALGIDPDEFYRERHNYIALPLQWMLDNVVWLYFKSKKANIVMEPSTEHFLLTTFRTLVRRLGYEEVWDNDNPGKVAVEKIEIVDYYQSMLLRGDSPDSYQYGKKMTNSPTANVWGNFAKINSEEINSIRRYNSKAENLIRIYLWDEKVRKRGVRIASFVVPSGYPKLIRDIQDEMIREFSKSKLGIECCPSSNYKIGYIKRFDRHPIFRFFPVREDKSHYPLPVTVNTDDLGVFSTSLPNEFSLLALALMKMKDSNGDHLYSSREVYDWIERIIRNGEKYAFGTIPGVEKEYDA